ncbi:hypothetical protein FPQ18DRAFT_420967 [Pyronema domesticum]|nr:hypothetical protein FPQ18DRAFT_420967 [Pyronema domesticum]
MPQIATMVWLEPGFSQHASSVIPQPLIREWTDELRNLDQKYRDGIENLKAMTIAFSGEKNQLEAKATQLEDKVNQLESKVKALSEENEKLKTELATGSVVAVNIILESINKKLKDNEKKMQIHNKSVQDTIAASAEVIEAQGNDAMDYLKALEFKRLRAKLVVAKKEHPKSTTEMEKRIQQLQEENNRLNKGLTVAKEKPKTVPEIKKKIEKKLKEKKEFKSADQDGVSKDMAKVLKRYCKMEEHQEKMQGQADHILPSARHIEQAAQKAVDAHAVVLGVTINEQGYFARMTPMKDMPDDTIKITFGHGGVYLYYFETLMKNVWGLTLNPWYNLVYFDGGYTDEIPGVWLTLGYRFNRITITQHPKNPRCHEIYLTICTKEYLSIPVTNQD